MSEYKVSIPTSTANNGNGIERDDSIGAEDLFDAVLAKVGEEFGKLPNGNTDKLDKASSVWKTFAEHEAITGAAARIESIKTLFDNTVDPTNLPTVLAHLDTLHGGATQLAAATTNIAAPVTAYHTGTVDVRAAFESALKTALIAITATLVVAAASACFTFGASLAAAGGGVTLVAADAALAIGTAYRASKLFQAIGLTAAAAGGAVTVGKVGAFDSVPSLSTVIGGLAGIIAMKVFIDDEDTGSGDGDSTEAQSSPPRPDHIPEDWVARRADNGKGWVWQKPGSNGNENVFRDAEPTARYPNGYVRYYNEHGQPVDLNGKPGDKASTHIPKNPDGTYPKPVGW